MPSIQKCALWLSLCLGWATPALAQQPKGCSETLGKPRAQRIVDHCIQTADLNHPPCALEFECGVMLELTTEGCQKMGPEPSDLCLEGADMSRLTDRQALQRYATTVTAAQTRVVKNRTVIKELRTSIEALLAQRKAALATLKTGQAAFTKELGAARSAHDKFKAASKKPGALGLDATREALKAQFLAVSAHGQALAKEAKAIDKLDVQLAALGSRVDAPRLQVLFAGYDVESASKAVTGVTVQLAKLASAKTHTDAAVADATAAKALSTQLTPVFKSVKGLAQETAKEGKALPTLAGKNAAAVSAKKQFDKTAAKIEQDRTQAQRTAEELDRAIQAVAARHRPNAPSAKASGCDLEKFDFDNFDYFSDLPSAPADRFKRGKSTSPDWKDFEEGRPHVAGKQFVDLSGSGKKVAIIYIEGPPSAHSGSDNQLHFMELDDQCRVQQLLALSGPVSSAEPKAKSYFYNELELGTPEGMNGLFPVGNQRVELRYVNGALVEFSRKGVPLD